MCAAAQPESDRNALAKQLKAELGEAFAEVYRCKDAKTFAEAQAREIAQRRYFRAFNALRMLGEM
jgi:hypothetical protein